MHSIFFPLLLTPLLRLSSQQISARKVATLPSLEYPTCRRYFTCAPPLKQDFRTIMTDLSKEDLEEVERLAEPAIPCESKILGESEGREEEMEALAQAAKGMEEPALPKLSAADFRIYNSMAEHMEYFVSPQSYALHCVNLS